MTNFGIFLLLLLLFYFLGKSADLTIIHIRKISGKLGIKIFFMGLILGLFTSMPELAVGVNALTQGVQEISLGNLLGGILVLFGLILAISLILNRKIITDGKVSSFLPILFYLFLPLLFGLDGQLGITDGIVLIFLYLLAIYFLYQKYKNSIPVSLEIIKKSQILKNIFFAVLGLILVIIFSNLIIRFSIILLENLRTPAFLLGLLLFSLGTNLPEIIVTLRSWKKRVKELSTSNLIGSAMANILIIGIFAIISAFQTKINLSYYLLMAFSAVLFLALMIFYKTDKTLTRKEGFILFTIYLAFVITQSFFLMNR